MAHGDPPSQVNLHPRVDNLIALPEARVDVFITAVGAIWEDVVGVELRRSLAVHVGGRYDRGA